MLKLDVTDEQVLKLVDQLPAKKIENLYHHLKHKYFVHCLDIFKKDVESRKKQNPITDEEIEEEVERTREELHKNRR